MGRMSLCFQFVKLETCCHIYCDHHATCVWSSLFCWHISYKLYFKTYSQYIFNFTIQFLQFKTYSIIIFTINFRFKIILNPFYDCATITQLKIWKLNIKEGNMFFLLVMLKSHKPWCPLLFYFYHWKGLPEWVGAD